MKKEMTAFDVLAITSEMQNLIGGFLDKIFHWDGRSVLFRINIQGEGKKELLLKDGKWLHIVPERPDVPDTPSGFAVHLRKILYNARIKAVSQREFDRIVTMDLASKEGEYQVIFEFIGDGNLIIVHEGKILNALEQKRWRHRDVLIGAEYVYPPSRFDPQNATLEEYEKAILSSKSDLVRTLATSVNLGGQYGEEVCLRTVIEKGRKASTLTHEEMEMLFRSTSSLLSELRERPRACLVVDSDDVVDATPIPLQVNSGMECREMPTFSMALAGFLAERKEIVERKDPELERLQRQLDQQLNGITALESEADILQSKGDLLYTNYMQVADTISRMDKLSQGSTWESLKVEGGKVPMVVLVDPKNRSFRMKVEESEIDLDYSVSIDENANRLYSSAKDLRERAAGARVALEETQKTIAKRVTKGEKEALLSKDRIAPTKQFWFETYKWFVTSGGRLVVAGRDVRSNDQVVKKHLGDKERYIHADVHGAPSVVMKNALEASEEEMKEACQFALCHSKAWTANAVEGTAYWVLPDQVSKRPEAGEFVPRGAFIIRGKRNYIYHLPLELAVGEIVHEGARKVMCAPKESVVDRSSRYAIIVPSKSPRSKVSSALARALEVPEEEISRILPPGDMEIKEAHGITKE